MNFLYQQIGLDDPQLQEDVNKIALKVLSELHGYADNHPVFVPFNIDEEESIDSVIELEESFLEAAELLKQHKIILYKYRRDKWGHGLSIATHNRYKLELLSAELTWLDRPEEEKGKNDNSAPFADYFTPFVNRLKAVAG